MTTTTTSLTDQRQSLIDQYLAFARQGADHRSHGRKALAASAEAKSSIASKRIRDVETEMVEGLEFTPWEKPASARSRVSRVQPWTPADAERLGKLGQVYKTTKKESVKANADSQITALLKRAERLAVTVKDPRK